MFRAFARVSALLPAVVTSLALLAAPASGGDDIKDTKDFRKAVKTKGIRKHQEKFQDFADAAGGNRVAGTPGYDASAEYVRRRMAAAGYVVTLQEFIFPFSGDQTPPVLERVTPPAHGFVDGVDFATMTGSGSGDVEAPLHAVDLVVPSPAPNTSTSGCEAADFAGFPAGAIALMQRGTCPFRDKALNALAAGAAGAIIFNEGNEGRTAVIFGTLGAPPVALSVVGTTFAAGDELRNGVLNGATGITVHLRTDVIEEDRTTRNVIAETPGGDPTRVVVVGAHLDSVSRGPGINDNGSGAGTILEVAEVYARRELKHDDDKHDDKDDDKRRTFRRDDGKDDDDKDEGKRRRFRQNKLRFIWFGAEEFGLLGSDHYVSQLSQAEQDSILLMLNFDMVGSPNFVRFVYDGDNSAFPPGPGGVQAGPPGSDVIEQVFVDYFASQRLPNEPTPFDGRSDYGPFIAVGIPAGGLFTGAEGVKTAEQAAIYGGVAGEQYDPCYHLACDVFDNVSLEALDQMADAVAHAVLHFARTKDAIRAPAPAAPGLRAAPVDPERVGHLLRK